MVSLNRSGLRRRIASLALPLAALTGHASAGSPVASAERPAAIEAVAIRDVPLAEVLRLVGERTGLRVVIHGDASARITAAFPAVPLDEGIKRLARGHSFVLN